MLVYLHFYCISYVNTLINALTTGFPFFTNPNVLLRTIAFSRTATRRVARIDGTAERWEKVAIMKLEMTTITERICIWEDVLLRNSNLGASTR